MDDPDGKVQIDPKQLQAVYEKRKKAGKSSPLDKRPEIPEDIQWIWSAFIELSDDRRFTNSRPLRITASEMRAWGDGFGLDREELQEFCYIIRVVDKAYLEWVSSKRGRGTVTDFRGRTGAKRHGSRTSNPRARPRR